MDKESLIILILTTLCWGQLVPTTDRIKKLYIANSYVVESDGKGEGGNLQTNRHLLRSARVTSGLNLKLKM